jgi:hypothetical protein
MLKFDYSDCCDNGKSIILSATDLDFIPLGDFFSHTKGCEACAISLNGNIETLLESLPPAVRTMAKQMLGGLG